ncbi:MAG: hypothetical protein KatS3mg129_2279 [Leptospiraceae bacterium]|nr:MAG: hypothetical protein KatS3mg129_2279 [Leptospiraceae bacterium]
MKRFYCFLIILILFCKTTKENKENIDKKSFIQSTEKIDCNYFWPARQVHVCIKEMPKEECESLFSLGQFLKEEQCYCDIHQKEKNKIETASYIQYDCK